MPSLTKKTQNTSLTQLLTQVWHCSHFKQVWHTVRRRPFARPRTTCREKRSVRRWRHGSAFPQMRCVPLKPVESGSRSCQRMIALPLCNNSQLSTSLNLLETLRLWYVPCCQAPQWKAREAVFAVPMERCFEANVSKIESSCDSCDMHLHPKKFV